MRCCMSGQSHRHRHSRFELHLRVEVRGELARHLQRTAVPSAADAMRVERLVLRSGDVGIGLNVRRMRDKFLGSFTTTYSLRPVGDDLGSVFRQWPEQWKVFVADADAPGRFRLAAERGSRPAGEWLCKARV